MGIALEVMQTNFVHMTTAPSRPLDDHAPIPAVHSGNVDIATAVYMASLMDAYKAQNGCPLP
jgi:hypothetical protein